MKQRDGATTNSAAHTPASVGRLLIAAGRTVTDEEDVLTLLQQAVELARDAIDGADSVGVTIDLAGRTYTAVHSDHRTLRVDSGQYEAGEGPGLEAARQSTVVRVDCDDAACRWPEFAEAARAEGIHSFLAAPLRTAETTLGSVNLYGSRHDAFEALDEEILALLTESMSRAIGDFSRYRSAQNVAASIQRALATRAPIEQAKGMLMALHGIDAEQAFDMLRQESQNKNIRLIEVAADLVQRLSEGRSDTP